MSTKRERGLAGGLKIDKLFLTLADAPFSEFERAFLGYERKELQSIKSESERLELKRRIAESILLGTAGRRCSWGEFSRSLQRIQRLGYTDVIKRCEVAARFSLSIGIFPEQEGNARTMLDEAERRLRFVRKDSVLRKEWMKEIRRIRRMTGWQDLSTLSQRRRKSVAKR
jgi:hypothetical protein